MKNRSRRSTYRRQLDRIENKRDRAATRAALSGSRPGLIRRSSWSSKPYEPEPVDPANAAGNIPKKRKPKAKITGCPSRPGNQRHHYLEDQELSELWGYVYNEDKGDWVYKVVGTQLRHYKLCGYCGREQTISYSERERLLPRDQYTLYPPRAYVADDPAREFLP